MPVIINGSTGISGTDGSASTPAVQGTDTNTGMFFPAADQIAFAEGGTEVMRIDASGNVGIGTSSPFGRFEVSGGNGTLGRFTGSGGAFQGIGVRNNHANSSTYGATFYDALNENAAAVANMLADINTDGSSSWSWSTQPAGTRTDRRVERARITAGGDFQFNSGYGSVATAFGCRAWVNFNGQGTVAIRASGNVSSITDNGVGDYTVNFTSAMPDVNYATFVALGFSGTNPVSRITNIDSAVYSTSAVRVRAGFPTNTFEDQVIMNVSILR